MSRIACKYVKTPHWSTFREALDDSDDDFSETMHVKEIKDQLHCWSDFEKIFGESETTKDFHRLLQLILNKNRRTLSIGACFGENEFPFIQSGYNLVCSDFNAEPVTHMQKYFSNQQYILFDIFSPNTLKENDFVDYFISGLDYAFDDFNTAKILKNCKKLIHSSTTQEEGRLIFTLRYNNNLGTKVIDELLLPIEYGLRNLFCAIKGSKFRYKRKVHGYRRSRKEIIDLAAKEGFLVRKIYYGGHGVELERLAFPRILGLQKLLSKADLYLNYFNNITIFELTLPQHL